MNILFKKISSHWIVQPILCWYHGFKMKEENLLPSLLQKSKVVSIIFHAPRTMKLIKLQHNYTVPTCLTVIPCVAAITVTSVVIHQVSAIPMTSASDISTIINVYNHTNNLSTFHYSECYLHICTYRLLLFSGMLMIMTEHEPFHSKT